MAEASAYELRGAGIDTTIVEPGAVGTTFGSTMVELRESTRLEEYGPGRRMFGAMQRGWQEHDNLDPQDVVDALVALIESTGDERPFRHPVGRGAIMPCPPGNEVQTDVRAAIMRHFRRD